jgi:hypothetical protein
MMGRILRVLVLIGALAVLLTEAWRQLGSPYQATVVLLSAEPISEVRIRIDKDPHIRSFEQRPHSDVFHAWDVTLIGPGPDMELSWVGPDGRRHSHVERLFHTDYTPRCVHIVRIDALGDIMRIGNLGYSTLPRMIEAVCR